MLSGLDFRYGPLIDLQQWPTELPLSTGSDQYTLKWLLADTCFGFGCDPNRAGAKQNPMENSTGIIEKERGEEEEEEEQKILRFLDATDSYLTLFDSLSSTLRQVIWLSCFSMFSLIIR